MNRYPLLSKKTNSNKRQERITRTTQAKNDIRRWNKNKHHMIHVYMYWKENTTVLWRYQTLLCWARWNNSSLGSTCIEVCLFQIEPFLMPKNYDFPAIEIISTPISIRSLFFFRLNKYLRMGLINTYWISPFDHLQICSDFKINFHFLIMKTKIFTYWKPCRCVMLN